MINPFSDDDQEQMEPECPECGTNGKVVSETSDGKVLKCPKLLVKCSVEKYSYLKDTDTVLLQSKGYYDLPKEVRNTDNMEFKQ